MRLRLALVGLALSACPRPQEQPAPAAVSVPSAAIPATEPASAVEPGRGDAVLFGTLHRLGTKICKDRDRADWEDLHLRAGLVRLEGNVRGLEALRGSPVILFGTATRQGKPELAPEPGTCMPFQRRSDWIDTPDGLILRREPAAGIASFRVRTGKRFDGLSASVQGDVVSIELTNPLDIAWADSVITVHYEGCYGKPGVVTERRELGKLAPGEKRAASAPTLAVRARGSRSDLAHRAASVQVTGHAERVYFDLDVSLEKLGVEVACPTR